MFRLLQLSITQYCCVNCDLGDPTEAEEGGCKGQAATQVEWKGGVGVRGQLSSMSGLLIRKRCLLLQGVHRVCCVLDTYSQSDINLPTAWLDMLLGLKVTRKHRERQGDDIF